MFGIGASELVMILIAGLIIFGPSELPKVGRAIGKGLREFRKAQAAFTATLDEVSVEPKKNSQPEKTSVEKVSDEKTSVEKTSAEKVSVEKVSAEKVSALKNMPTDTPPPHSALTVDDVINLAKESPLKENLNEKNFTAADSTADTADASKRDDDSRSNTNSAGEQSRSATN